MTIEKLAVQAYKAQEKAAKLKEQLKAQMAKEGISDLSTGEMIGDKEIAVTLSDSYISTSADTEKMKNILAAMGIAIPMKQQVKAGPFSIKLRLPKKEDK